MRAAMIRAFERTPISPGTVVSEKGGLRYEAQSQWRFLILIAFFTGGFGAALYIASWALDFRLGMVLGVFLVAVIKGGAHIAYLGRPERFWRALKRPRTSWISRGIISMGVFVIAGALYPILQLAWLGWLAVTAAAVVMAYTGYLMAFSPAIPFWNNALLPLLFLIFSAESGCALAIPLYRTFAGARVEMLDAVEVMLLALVAIIIFSYLYGAYHSSVSAREAVRLLVRGRLAVGFFLSVALLGLAVPIALETVRGIGAMSVATSWVAAVLCIQGAIFFRWAVLRAGVYAPPGY
jgi:formate-dependent nitrite reductase membrane component NrfD